MKINSVFWLSRIWLVLGIVLIFSFLLVSHQAYASGGEVHLTIRIPSVLAVQYAPTTYNGVKVGTSRDIQTQRAILIERTEILPGKDQHHPPEEKYPNSAKRVYITIHIL